MTNPSEDVSLPTDLPGLEAALARLETIMQEGQKAIQQLMDDEDPASGVFHAAEIHDAKQKQMSLRFQRDLCLARIRRLNKDD